jgi:CBS domain-containing protein
MGKKTKKQPKRKLDMARRESGQPGGGQGRVDKVELGPVWPGSGPWPNKAVPIITPGSFGQGERGDEGYYDSGDSSLDAVMRIATPPTPASQSRRVHQSAVNIGRVCVREVDLADEKETVWQAAERMHQRAVGSLVIVNDSQKPIGILTDRDLVERVLARGNDPNSTLVRDVMTADPKTVSEDASIGSALSLMRSGFRRLPVVDTDDKLVGLLSLDDVLMLLAEEFAMVGQVLERETPRGVAAKSMAQLR